MVLKSGSKGCNLTWDKWHSSYRKEWLKFCFIARDHNSKPALSPSSNLDFCHREWIRGNSDCYKSTTEVQVKSENFPQMKQQNDNFVWNLLRTNVTKLYTEADSIIRQISLKNAH